MIPYRTIPPFFLMFSYVEIEIFEEVKWLIEAGNVIVWKWI
jgi:hypothetical protein